MNDYLSDEELDALFESCDHRFRMSHGMFEFCTSCGTTLRRLPHIPESEKRQKEPERGVSVDAEKHPDYPIRHGVPAMDRCICGGVRHWHAPDGCDDCDCRGFVLDENWRP
jgi:hypothetical protein